MIVCCIAVFLVHPSSMAAVDGSTVEFTYTANGNTADISYRIDGLSLSSPDNTDPAEVQGMCITKAYCMLCIMHINL